MMTNRRSFVKQLATAGVSTGIPMSILSTLLHSRVGEQSGEKSELLELVSPESIGMDAEILNQVDILIEEAIAISHTPGAVVAIGRGNKMGLLRGYGYRQFYPDKEEITLDTLFDLASVTKVASTATALAIVVDRGLVSPDDLVIKYFPSFGVKGKDQITVRHLATHTSGLGFYNHFIKGKKEELFDLLCSLSLNSPVGEKYEYNDNNALMIGHIVEKVSGQDLNEFTRENIYKPMGMVDTMYKPDIGRTERTAATEMRDGKWYKGIVNDFATFNLGGVGGDTGLFSTAPDLAILSALWLGKGTYLNRSEKKIELFGVKTYGTITASQETNIGLRGLLWDKRSGQENRPWNMSPDAFGHGGWTGTSIWIDPKLDLFVVVLGNRRHPFGQTPNIYPVASNVGVVAVHSILYRNQSLSLYYNQEVRFSNLPRISPNSIHSLKGQKIGLILLQEELENSDGLFQKIKDHGVEVVGIYFPENIISEPGNQLAEASYSDLPIYTIRNDSPRILPSEFKDVETVVFGLSLSEDTPDEQFYQYINLLGHTLQAAADYNIKYAIIESENPLKGKYIVLGSLADKLKSFGVYFREARQYGLSFKEIAMKINVEQKLGLNLEIIPKLEK